MYPCPICGFECDSYEEAEECRKTHNFNKPRLCPKCAEPMNELISANWLGKSYNCEHCKKKYSKEELESEIKRITQAKP